MQISQVTKFRNTAPAPAVDCFLTRFLFGVVQNSLDVILVPLDIVVISLLLSIYISSIKLVISINLSVHPSINKNWAQSFLSLGWFVIFSQFPSLSCIFSLAKHPLMMIN